MWRSFLEGMDLHSQEEVGGVATICVSILAVSFVLPFLKNKWVFYWTHNDFILIIYLLPIAAFHEYSVRKVFCQMHFDSFYAVVMVYLCILYKYNLKQKNQIHKVDESRKVCGGLNFVYPELFS